MRPDLTDPNAPEPTVLLRREALAAGIDDRALQRAVRAGELVRVRHGAYVAADVWAGAEWRERHLIVARAAHRTHGGRVAFSHHTAACLHGLDLWNVDLRTLHATRTDETHGRRAAGIVHHQGFVDPAEVQWVRGLPVVSLARAALESASLVPLEQGLVTLDSALRGDRCDKETLQRRYAVVGGWPHSLGLQLAVTLADGRHESAGESRTGHLLWRSGLPAPVPQLEVLLDGRVIARVDFAWPAEGVVLEFDGKEKYLKYLRPGETVADAVLREKRREDLIREVTGWTVVRVVWADLADPRRLIARIERAMRRTAAA